MSPWLFSSTYINLNLKGWWSWPQCRYSRETERTTKMPTVTKRALTRRSWRHWVLVTICTVLGCDSPITTTSIQHSETPFNQSCSHFITFPCVIFKFWKKNELYFLFRIDWRWTETVWTFYQPRQKASRQMNPNKEYTTSVPFCAKHAWTPVGR